MYYRVEANLASQSQAFRKLQNESTRVHSSECVRFGGRIPQRKRNVPMPESKSPLANDLLTGAHAIAAYLGKPWNARKIYHAARKQNLPIGFVGKLLVARKHELDRSTLAAPAGPRAA